MTAAPSEADRVPFSQQLRESTREAHHRAENSPFISELLNGSAGLDRFTELATQHYFIYSALESAEALRDPVAGRFAIDGLDRVPALETDLAFLIGQDWKSQVEPNQATADYCARVREVSRSWPGGYIAHHYTRYLGDVSGGQVIRAWLRNEHGVTGDGARFYDFRAVGSPVEFRRRYRALLDAAPWNDSERERIVAEARVAFDLNTAVFNELDRCA